MSDWLLLLLVILALGPTAWTNSRHVVLAGYYRLRVAMRGAGETLDNRRWVAFSAGLLCGVVLAGVVPRLVRVDWPSINLPNIPSITTTKVDRVTYVYEKDSGGVPSGVMAALDKLNRQGILATKFEDDTTNANQQIPAQYRIAHAEATKFGLPALVVQGGESVVRVVKVSTEAETLEAAK